MHTPQLLLMAQLLERSQGAGGLDGQRLLNILSCEGMELGPQK